MAYIRKRKTTFRCKLLNVLSEKVVAERKNYKIVLVVHLNEPMRKSSRKKI